MDKKSANLLKKQRAQQQSMVTIQTDIVPMEQPFSINDYVKEHDSLMEQTKVKVAAKRKKKHLRIANALNNKNDSGKE